MFHVRSCRLACTKRVVDRTAILHSAAQYRSRTNGQLIEQHSTVLGHSQLFHAFAARAKSKPDVKTSSKNHSKHNLNDVTIVNTLSDTRRVVKMLMSEELRDRVHAIDTEVANIDFEIGHGVDHGYITCVTIYVGPDVDFGNGPRLFIDCLDVLDDKAHDVTDQLPSATNQLVMEILRPYLEEFSIRKIFHNHAFDCHQFANQSITVKGFAADTMHMGQLLEPDLRSYQLSQLSSKYLTNGRSKVSMKDLGMDPSATLINQRGVKRPSFIEYAAYDAQATWELHEAFANQLAVIPWRDMNAANLVTEGKPYNHFALSDAGNNQLHLYHRVFVPLSEAMISMDRTGARVDKERLLQTLRVIQDEIYRLDQQFITWLGQYTPNAHDFDWTSAAQKRHVFFGEGSVQFSGKSRVGSINETSSKKTTKFELTGLGLSPVEQTNGGQASVAAELFPVLCGKVRRQTPLYGPAYDHFKKMNGGNEQKGIEACEAIDSKLRSLDLSLLANSFSKLLKCITNDSRIHMSFFITDRGNVSIRTAKMSEVLGSDPYQLREAIVPSEGNILMLCQHRQLPLRMIAEQTKCKSMLNDLNSGYDLHALTTLAMYDHVREAADKDGVRLENIDTWLTNQFPTEFRCAMLMNLFHAHGISDLDIVREWTYLSSEPEHIVMEWMQLYSSAEVAETTPKGSEPTRTTVGKVLELWNHARPEVAKWRGKLVQNTKRAEKAFTRLGRGRPVSRFTYGRPKTDDEVQRLALKTSVHGSIADAINLSLLRIHANARLHEIGWRLVLMHDGEFLVEGPPETADEAQSILSACMARPFKDLTADLAVEFGTGQTWHEAKQQLVMRSRESRL